MLEALFDRFDNIVVLDTETTGINCRKNKIIELAALRAVKNGETYKTADSFDLFLRLPEGQNIPPEIVELTGITDKMLSDEGIMPAKAAQLFSEMLSSPKTLVVAYNAQFDMCFLYFLLAENGLTDCLKSIKMLDALSVYKDRREYPHRLCNAVESYSLKTQNTHRAIDDAAATMELIAAMDAELSDLDRYINLFGYNPKYGVSGPKISSVQYLPQEYNNKKKLYEL